jgi:DNA-binding HxlR family transcriptional regulator
VAEQLRKPFRIFHVGLLRRYELNGGSFNWRVRRLVENGLLERHSVRGVSPDPIYSITNVGKHMLADHFPVMDGHRTRMRHLT